MVLWLRKQFWENCRKKTPRVARFTPQVQNFFKNRKHWQKNVIPLDALMDIQIAILITLTNFWPTVRENFAQFPISSSCVLIHKNLFVGLVFGTRFDNLLRFCPKWTRFCPPSVKTIFQSKKLLRIFFPQVVHLVVLKALFWRTPTNGSAERTEKCHSNANFFSLLVQKLFF